MFFTAASLTRSVLRTRIQFFVLLCPLLLLGTGSVQAQTGHVAVDPSFDPGTGGDLVVTTIAVLSDDKILSLSGEPSLRSMERLEIGLLD